MIHHLIRIAAAPVFCIWSTVPDTVVDLPPPVVPRQELPPQGCPGCREPHREVQRETDLKNRMDQCKKTHANSFPWRVEDWRGGAGYGMCARSRTPSPIPATSNPACDFPAPGFPGGFTGQAVGPIVLKRLWGWRSESGNRHTIPVAPVSRPYSIASSRNPVASSPASSAAVPSSRPRASRRKSTARNGRPGSSSPSRAGSG